jgi:predicted PurR-regulated permease PerM
MSKEEQRLESYRRTVAVVVSVIVILLAFLIIRPFLVAILSAAALAYIFYPMYLNILRYLPKRLRAKELGSILTCIFIVLLVLIPAIFVTVVLTAEMRGGYYFLKDFLADQQPFNNLPPALSQWSAYMPQFKEVATDLAGQLIGVIQGVLKSVPGVILSIFITVFSMYYFLKHGKDLYKFFSELIPLPEGRYKQILLRFDDLSRGMIMGQIVVGMVQGVLAWLGFWALGVPNPVLLGFMTAIISIIPLLGAAIVWVPVDLYLLMIALSTGEYWRAVALLVYGTFVISLIDNFMKPKIVGDRAKIHPLIILFGILGGIQLFGIPGILIGPLILTIFDVVIEIYKETL